MIMYYQGGNFLLSTSLIFHCENNKPSNSAGQSKAVSVICTVLQFFYF